MTVEGREGGLGGDEIEVRVNESSTTRPFNIMQFITALDYRKNRATFPRSIRKVRFCASNN